MISACRDDRHRYICVSRHLDREPERTAFYEAIATADRCLVSAVTYQEAGQVLIARRGVNGLYDLEDLLALIKAEVVPHDANLAAMALEAFRRYGKGIDPKARLNFCDCAAYALANAMKAPLLFKGDDFAATACKRRCRVALRFRVPAKPRGRCAASVRDPVWRCATAQRDHSRSPLTSVVIGL